MGSIWRLVADVANKDLDQDVGIPTIRCFWGEGPANPHRQGEGRGRPLPHVRPRGLFGFLALGLKTGYPG